MGIVLALLIAVALIVAEWKIFTKAGKPGWAIFVPIYSTIVLLQIVGKPWWWLFLMSLLPVVFGVWVINLLAKSFGKTTGFTLGLLFLSPIFLCILGFGKAEYKGPAAAEANVAPAA